MSSIWKKNKQFERIAQIKISYFERLLSEKFFLNAPRFSGEKLRKRATLRKGWFKTSSGFFSEWMSPSFIPYCSWCLAEPWYTCGRHHRNLRHFSASFRSQPGLCGTENSSRLQQRSWPLYNRHRQEADSENYPLVQESQNFICKISYFSIKVWTNLICCSQFVVFHFLNRNLEFSYRRFQFLEQNSYPHVFNNQIESVVGRIHKVDDPIDGIRPERNCDVLEQLRGSLVSQRLFILLHCFRIEETAQFRQILCRTHIAGHCLLKLCSLFSDLWIIQTRLKICWGKW